MLKRIMSGIIGLIILLFIVIKGGMILNISVLGVSLIGIFEFNNTVKKLNINPMSFFIYFFAIALFIISIFQQYDLIVFIIFLYSIAIISYSVIRNKFNFTDVAFTLLGGIYIGFFLHHIRFLSETEWIWLVFIISWGTDTFAYFTGYFLGRRKLCPELSPKKTVEGSIGGIIGSLLFTLTYLYLFNIGHIVELSILSIMGSIMAQIGDLAASKLKRMANVKDYGSIMPGHGGVLDRFDSILFTAPLVYYYVTYII